MLTLQDVELLAGLLSRAPVTPVEAVWANMVLDRLRALAIEAHKGGETKNEQVLGTA